MGALLRALASRGYDDIEAALHVRGCTSQAMRDAITSWFAAWFEREPDKGLEIDPCQRLPYAIVNKLCKAIFAEYDSGLQDTGSARPPSSFSSTTPSFCISATRDIWKTGCAPLSASRARRSG